jgi:hypothetical protein
MNCQEALPYISPLFDGEEVPADVPSHVQACAACRQRLKEYALVDAECRLLNSATRVKQELPAWLPRANRRWNVLLRLWGGQVMVSWATLTVGVLAILGLTVELNWIQTHIPSPEISRQSVSQAHKVGNVVAATHPLEGRNDGTVVASLRAPEQIAARSAPAVPEKRAVYQPVVAKNPAENSCLTMYRPDWGLFIFAFHPFPDSREAALNNGQVLFELDGRWYYVSPTSGITKGKRGVIYYRLIRGYEPAANSDQSGASPTDSLVSTTHQFLPGCSEEKYLF